MARSQTASEPPKRRFAPATSVEGRENQLINLAIDRAEEQLANGTASAQVITHYLKLGSTTARLEQERLRQAIELDKAKIKAMGSETEMLALYDEAIKAMSRYQGQSNE